MKWSVSIVAEGDRVLTSEEIVELADAVAASGGIASGARSAAMRTAMLNDEISEANAVGERMTIPGSLLGVIFMALLVAPSLLRMFSNT